MSEPQGYDEGVEERFGQVVLAKGMISAEQLSWCQLLRNKKLERGESIRLGVVMIQEGLITKTQALAALKEAHRAVGDHARIGGYELLNKVGEGAMGAVYRAKQLSMDRIVALKLLPRALSEQAEARERFLREARIVARLNHPYIVRGFEVGEGNGYHFFAMEFVEGGSTGHRLRHQGPLPEEEVITIGIEMAEALHHAHLAGVIHRDVKPDNIMIGSESYKLADLGLATRAEEESSLTKTGMAVGTPYYMSPEQVEGWEDMDLRSDIYGLGASLYHLVTGNPPFTGTSALAIMTQRLREDPLPACSVSSLVSRGLTAILMRCLKRDRRERYSDCLELMNDLKRLEAGERPECYALAADSPRKGRLQFPVFRLTGPLLVRAVMACTPRRLLITACALFIFAVAGWSIKNAELLRGPVHPRDPARVYSGLPEPAVNRGKESQVAWEKTCEELLACRKDTEKQKQILVRFIALYPKSVYARLARELLVDLGGTP